MSQFDFDELIERRGSGSYKWDGNQREFGNAALLPFWVADMDFAVAPAIREAIAQRLQHPVLGYEERPAAYAEAQIEWLQRRHQWQVPPTWLKFCPPSSMVAMHGLISTATSPGCSVIVPTPTYGPLIDLVEQTGRRLIRVPLRESKQRFELDAEGIAQRVEADTEMILFCNPHNPTGRVFEEAELNALCRIAERHDLILLSDEVHADLVRPGFRHRPLGSLGYEKSVTVLSPNKAFNTAGLPQCTLVIPDPALRDQLQHYLDLLAVNHDSSFGGVAMIAAYRQGDAWLDAVMRYIDDNHRFVAEFIAAEVPGLRVWPAEATYLAWLDFRQSGLTEREIQDRLISMGGVALYRGSLFGEEGRGFLRMNIACPRQTLERGLAGIRRSLT
ncbi:MAG: PatB family C-S lyase [Woeseia sp.]